MNQRLDKIINFSITYEEDYIKKLRPIPHELDVQMPNLFLLATKGKKSGIKRLKRLIEQYPNEPTLKNYLSVLYNNMGDKKRSNEVNHYIVEKHPDYLFGKLNLASEYYDMNEFDKMKEILGENFNLKELYPERDVFHIIEVEGIFKMAGMYYIGVNSFDKAREYIDALFELDLDDAAELLQIMLSGKILECNVDIMENNVKIKEQPTILSNKTAPPEFKIKEVEQLYLHGLDIDVNIIIKILNSNREDIISDLNKVLKDGIERYQYFSKNNQDIDINKNTYFIVHALIILSEIEAIESLENIFELLSQNYDFIDFYLGDIITEDVWMMLYKIGNHNLDDLQDFLKRPGINTFHKTAVLDVFLQVALHQPQRRNDVVNRYRDLLEFFLNSKIEDNVIDSGLIGMLISDIVDLGAKELLPEIEAFFERGYVDIMICGNIESVKTDLTSKPSMFSKREVKDIYKIYQGYENWFNNDFLDDGNSLENDDLDYIDEEDNNNYSIASNALPFVREERKIGRNEPCPCGSGKKYKKCCMNK